MVWMQGYDMKVLDGRRLVGIGVFSGVWVGRVLEFVVMKPVITPS